MKILINFIDFSWVIPMLVVNEGSAVPAIDAEVKLVPVHVALPQLCDGAQLISI